MAVMAMAHAELRISGFERSGICSYCCNQNPFSQSWVLSSRRPIFGVTLNTKNVRKKKMRMFALRVLNSSGLGGVIEKELEFKPSFDEYLKAMESVKTGREKKQVHKSNRRNSEDDSRGKRASKTVSPKRNEEDLTLKKFGVFSEEDNASGKGAIRARRSKEFLGKGQNNDAKVLKKFDSVKTGGYKKEVYKSSRRNSEGDSTGKIAPKIVLSKRDEEEVSLKIFGVFSKEEKKFQTVECNDENANGKVATGTRRSKVKAFLVEGEDNDLEVERAAFKNFEEFNDIVDKPPVSRREMEERIQNLAKSLNGADINMPEWMFSKMMRSAKIRFSDYSILRVIQVLGKLGNWRRVLQMIEWLQTRERFKSHRLRHIYTTALDVLGKARRPVEALNVFHAMQQEMSSYPDLVAYHCIAVTLGQAGHMKELFDVIDSMRSPPKKKFKTGALGNWDARLEPDIVVYNAVLNACARRKQWEGAFWVLQQLKQRGQQPSTTTYGLVMEVMFECGKYNLVHEFFKKRVKSSMPNALAYRVLVNTLWKEGKIDEAVLTVQDMERRGIVGSAALYYDLARCLGSAGRCQEALSQIEKICKVANKPLVVTYTGLIQACLDSGNIQTGEYIFNHMQEFCSPNLVTCNIIMKAYLEHGYFNKAKELFQKMEENVNHISSKSDYKHQAIPDIYTFSIMLDACTQDQRWHEFEYVYGRMLHHGYPFNVKRHLRMILEAARAGKGELLETTWEHLIQADRVPPPPLIKERFCMNLEKKDHVAALSCVASHHLSGELQAFSKLAWLNLLKGNSQRFRQETIVELIDELNTLMAKSEPPSPVLHNLLTACKEYLSTRLALPWNNFTETICTNHSK